MPAKRFPDPTIIPIDNTHMSYIISHITYPRPVLFTVHIHSGLWNGIYIRTYGLS